MVTFLKRSNLKSNPICLVQKIYLSLIVIIFLLSACRDSGDNSEFIRKYNPNALISPEKYKNRDSRTLKEYTRLLGEGFANHLEKLDKDSFVIDSGGGLGLAALQISKKYDVKVMVINTQDMWKKVFLIGDMLNQNIFQENQLPQNIIKHGISLAKLQDLFLLSQETFGKNSLKLYQKVFSKVISFNKERAQKGKYQYKIGFSEEILSECSSQASVIIDVFGAFFFSPLRHELLEHYYRCLKVGGSAYIYIGGEITHKIRRMVIQKSGSKLLLYDYLTTKWPNIFSIRKQNITLDYFDLINLGRDLIYPKNHVLIIKKDPKITKIDLGLTIGKMNKHIDVFGTEYFLTDLKER